MKATPPLSVTVARLENEAAPAPARMRLAPGPLRSNWREDSDEPWRPPVYTGKAPASGADLVAARYAAVLKPDETPRPLAGCQGRPVCSYREVKIRKGLGTFRVLKKGPRAGQTVEDATMIRLGIWSVLTSDGVEYVFTSRSVQVRVHPKVGKAFTLTPDACRRTFRRIFRPDQAERAIAHLLGAA